jgi:hypothetical protein
MSGWIGVDLDGTLAEYGGWVSEAHIGKPVPRMAARVRSWLAAGRDVRIFTARVDGGEVALLMGNQAGEKFKDVERIRSIIQDWTEEHFGVRLPVTNKKDYGMVELWDDRAMQVIPNTGDDLASIVSRYMAVLIQLQEWHSCECKELAFPDEDCEHCLIRRALGSVSDRGTAK